MRKHLRKARTWIIDSGGLNRFVRYGIPYEKLLMMIQLFIILIAQSLGSITQIVAISAAVLTAVLVGSIYNIWTYPRYMVPGGAIITALIVAGIAAPGDITAVVGITVMALMLKYLISVDQRNIFNPAALALYVGALFFDVGLTWWASGSLLVIGLGIVTAYLVKVHDILLSFLVPYWLLTFLFIPAFIPQSTAAVLGLLQSYVIFFAVIMVVEPVTSPNRPRSRIIYGAAVAVIAVALQVVDLPAAVTGLLADNLLLALLVMNAVHRILPDRYMA